MAEINLPNLPILEALPTLKAALSKNNKAVLIAPPGAGKTTCVPLSLLSQPWRESEDGKIIMLEPRRLAAKASARRMAMMLREKTGERIGYRVRMESRISSKTRIEVVTEGVFARMILEDPSLQGIAAVLFDEFHERNLDGDKSLAFALDAQAALREDLRILVMSATLDGGRVSGILDDAPVIESLGRTFPVEALYRPRKPRDRLEEAICTTVQEAVRDQTGSILVFLPGQAEIMRVADRLKGKVPKDCLIAPLFGAMDGRDQDHAIQPAPKEQRKIVLATSIAETSLTIEGVRIIIDSGLVRRPHFEPGLGLSRLETVRVSRASAEQRQGRAGRTEPGLCYRLWDKGQMAALPAFEPPEILQTDLSRLVLDLALWGERDPEHLQWLDRPPKAGWQEAVKLLKSLEALDQDGGLTAHGKQMAGLPVPPRLAHMIVKAAEQGQEPLACLIAALLSEGGRLRHNDLRRLLQDLKANRLNNAKQIKALAKRWQTSKTDDPIRIEEAGRILSLAYPDRIAVRRGAKGGYLLASGRGGMLGEDDPLNASQFLVVADLQGAASKARITLAASITRIEIDAELGHLFEEREKVEFDKQSGSIRARQQVCLGNVVLEEQKLKHPSPEAIQAALIEAIRKKGLKALPFSKDLERWRGRIQFIAEHEQGWPDFSDNALLEQLDQWLGPFLAGKMALDELSSQDLGNALQAQIPYERLAALDDLLPSHIIVPTGSKIPIDYGVENGPALAVRVQELFGLDEHPTIMGGQIPLLLHLLSPAHRPIQLTRDLPTFWRGSWKEVKADMKGQYPKHVWPDDPLTTKATRHTKAKS
ncbi:MAG: ATP-dependent helicase HrpB [Cohaesibacter sp.]|nr:ATP-dependent helicase HrpB [Cohaesibacter sp.]